MDFYYIIDIVFILILCVDFSDEISKLVFLTAVSFYSSLKF